MNSLLHVSIIFICVFGVPVICVLTTLPRSERRKAGEAASGLDRKAEPQTKIEQN